MAPLYLQTGMTHLIRLPKASAKGGSGDGKSSLSHHVITPLRSTYRSLVTHWSTDTVPHTWDRMVSAPLKGAAHTDTRHHEGVYHCSTWVDRGIYITMTGYLLSNNNPHPLRGTVSPLHSGSQCSPSYPGCIKVLCSVVK
jgi:hypothetical protein